MPNRSRSWNGKTSGGDWGQRFLISLIGKTSLRAAYVLLDIVLPFYLLFNRKGFRATRSFFEGRLGVKGCAAFRMTYATHRNFGQMMFDRFRLFSKGTGEFSISVEGNEEFISRMDTGDGFVVAGSHLGSMEMAGYMLGLKDKPINAVVYGGETATMQSSRSTAFSGHGVKMIPVSSDMSHLFAVKAALDEGEVVSMPCDRLLGSNKAAVRDFLGAPARFPIGAFVLAAQLEKDMVALFSVRESFRTYRVFVHPLQVEREGLGYRKVADNLATAYVGRLEELVRRYPTQWFNFHDFWAQDE